MANILSNYKTKTEILLSKTLHFATEEHKAKNTGVRKERKNLRPDLCYIASLLFRHKTEEYENHLYAQELKRG